MRFKVLLALLSFGAINAASVREANHTSVVASIQRNKPAIVSFYSGNSRQGVSTKGVDNRIARHFGRRINIVRVNADRNKALIARYGIKSIPSHVFLHKGKAVAVHKGTLSYRDYSRFVKAFAKGKAGK